MLCFACAAPAKSGALCSDCDRSLRLAPSRLVGSTIVQPVFHHSGAAVRLVHSLKYRRSFQAGRFLGSLMAERLPTHATSLVPVPRVLSRRIAYGVDQTAVLAAVVSQISGVPVVRALGSPVWSRRSAGKGRSQRQTPRFTRRITVARGAVLIDDVCTTGGTVLGAVAALGAEVSSLVATSASMMSIGAAPAVHGGDVAHQRHTAFAQAAVALPRDRSVSHPPGDARLTRHQTVPTREENR
jgi:predicted amidophosphoribosyltransferase